MTPPRRPGMLTIGVYGFDSETFLGRLRDADVRLLLDVHADLTPIVSALPSGGTAALLCVERDPEACHRSLIAQRLAERHGLTIAHLRPP